MIVGRFSNFLAPLALVAIASASLSTGVLGQSAVEELDPKVFPVPSSLEPNVRFWTDIYSRYSSHQAVVHDELHLEIVYEILDLSDLDPGDPPDPTILKARSKRFDEARDRISAALRDLSNGGQATSDLARHLQRVWSVRPGRLARYAEAAGRVRSQVGLRDRFEVAVGVSGRYMSALEQAFAEEKVPVVLSRLPFVESMFQSNARSKVGAAGAWQFMPSTARHYLQMDSAVDSRMDPILAAHGAARLLASNFDSLKSWPLAITAYNHGAGGMRRAVRTTGSHDIGVIVDRYQSRSFGFASRNFYAEFVAAFNVYANRATHFPGAVPDAPLRFDEVEFDHFVSIADLALGAGLEMGSLRELNPALSPDIFTERLLIPKRYPLRVPLGSTAAVVAAYEGIPHQRKLGHQLERVYRVQRGDTLSGLASRFGTSSQAIQRANNLSSANRIYIGQALLIPGQAPSSFGGFGPEGQVAAVSSASRTSLASSVGGPQYHTVQSGESLARIANRYGTDVRTLAALNTLRDPDRLSIGTKITLPAGQGAGGEEHVVRSGENLTMIARRYGLSTNHLKSYNALSTTILQPGQVLRLP